MSNYKFFHGNIKETRIKGKRYPVKKQKNSNNDLSGMVKNDVYQIIKPWASILKDENKGGGSIGVRCTVLSTIL